MPSAIFALSLVTRLAGRDVAAILLEEALLDHRADELLMHHRDVGVGFLGAGLGLETLQDLLRPGVTGAGTDGAHRIARILLLEDRREILVDIVDHVLVAGSDHREFRRRDGRHRRGKDDRCTEKRLHEFPPTV
ncbi:hypothetical protein [Jiella pelagia]|uniref:Secreted protein n=1 Tax=Jiella pelagia TaxID=2986949 RepID=A0ABY7C4J6_9HYPH|nr:hypothetical protein [Jiella pelagia]WAP70953.1 hypothetical protein OH818_13885 [Jiella pelagia]